MSIDRVGQGLETLSELLNKTEHDPNPERTDWREHEATLDEIETLVEQELLGCFEAARDQLEEANEAAVVKLRSVIADRVGDAAALLLAAGRRARALTLLQRASEIGDGGKEAKLCVAGIGDPERFTRLIRAWWLIGQGRRDEARVAAKTVLDGAPTVMAESARTILDAPTPIDGPPGLGTLNGFGVSVYGHRDPHPNGTYVKTRYITALFIPIFPLGAYRVADAEDNAWYFLGKVPLSPLHVWWRRLFVVGLLLLVIGGTLSSHYNSASYRLEQAIAAAEQAEREAGPEGRAEVIDQYEAVLNRFPGGDPVALQPVVEAFVRLSAEEVHSPLTVEHLAEAKRLVLRYQALPEVAKRPSHAGPMVAVIERWAEELGTEGHPQILAALELLGHAEALTRGEDQQRLIEHRRALGRTLAERLAVDWPLEAIRQYVSLEGDPESVKAAAALIDELGEGPSVWLELGPTVSTWASYAAEYPELSEIRQRAIDRIDAAHERADDPERQALLVGTDEDGLAAALADHPSDQQLAVALANLRMGRGDAEGALAVLTALGSPGQMVMGAQVALASIQFETGQQAEADALLEQVLSNRLPAFENARRAFVERSEALTDKLVQQGQQGRLPADVLSRLERAPEAEQMQIFSEWHDEQLSSDPELSRLREEYAALSGVIDVAIQWGTIKLRRAQGATGDERQALLDGAERAFLAIASDGQGVPSYHLGLGQVYYRLGKEEEGERELSNLLDGDDPPQIQLAVARTYRDLGLVDRAKQVATTVYEQSDSPVKEAAATLMSISVTDFDDRRTWLQRAGDDPIVQLQLIELDADELRMKGDLAAADDKYAQVVEGWTKDAETNSSAANNAAVTLFARFACTGDLARLREAVTLLERSRSLEPDSAVVLGNLASAVESLAAAELLGTWVRTRQLLLDSSEIDDLIGLLAAGPMGDEVREALGDSPSLRRALELSHQEQVLAPRRLDAHKRLQLWYSRQRDGKRLAELARVVGQSTLEKSRELESIQRYLDGSHDADRLEQIDSRLLHFEAQRPQVERRGHGPTLAALHWARGELLVQKAIFTKDASHARDAAAAFATAHETWPQLGAHKSQARALVQVALLEAASASEAMQKAYDEYRRLYGTVALLAWLLEDDGDALAALRSQPALAEAAALRRDEASEALAVSDWILARVAQDEALTAASRPALERPGGRDRTALDVQLSPLPEASEVVLRQLDG